ncbi:MAG: hypothetical protein ACM37W_02555 [Actinomycetota bacterium]
MMSQADAIDKAFHYAFSRLGISGKTAVAEQDEATGNWKVLMTGQQEEELLMVNVQLNVEVYEDTNGEAKCRLLMAPNKSEEVTGQLKQAEFFAPHQKAQPQVSSREEIATIENNPFPD